MSASDKWPGFVQTKEGEEFVQTNANYFKYDLCYNSMRFESWLKLAKILDEVRLLKELILDETSAADLCIWLIAASTILLYSGLCRCKYLYYFIDAYVEAGEALPMLIFWVLCLFQEVDLLLNDGSKNINVVEWRKTGLLASRVELSRRQSRRSLLMALTLAVNPDQKVQPEPLLYAICQRSPILFPFFMDH